MELHQHIKNQIWTIDHFLTKQECRQFINQINTKSNKICFTNTGLFENDKYIDQSLATSFFEKINTLPKIKTLVTNPILRANNLIMTGKYLSNNNFGLHTDTGLFYNKNTKEKSQYTLLIYLNDDFEGGTTSFFTDNFQPTVTIHPKQGTALLFDIDLWHKGDKLISGEKYWIGCELIAKF